MLAAVRSSTSWRAVTAANRFAGSPRAATTGAQGVSGRRPICQAHIGQFSTQIPDAVQVGGPFHVVKLTNTVLDECRGRVQNETLGH